MRQDINDKLLRLLEHARRSTPFYMRLLPPSTTLLPKDVAELFSQLPMLTRSEVQNSRFWLRSLVGNVSTWRAIRTSGTTGEPVEILLDGQSREDEFKALSRHISRYIPEAEWRGCKLMHVVMHSGSVSRSQFSKLHPESYVAKWNLLQLWQATDEEFVTQIMQLDQCIVTLLPSVAELMARRVVNAGVSSRVKPLIIILSGETIEPAQIRLIQTAFSCIVTSLYTMAEVGIVGTRCPLGDGYHIEEDSLVVEIIDENGRSAAPGCEGEIIVTALNNFAMPLVRYRTADRGSWCGEQCGCTLTTPRLNLVSARRPSYLLSADGNTVNVVRFAKLLASLNVNRFSFEQEKVGMVTVSYQASEYIEEDVASVIASSVRAALGPQTSVRFRRASEFTIPACLVRGTKNDSEIVPLLAEPVVASAPLIVEWLKDQLEGRETVEVAVLTGSFVTPGSFTSFSDIDLVILVKEGPEDPSWPDLCRRLRRVLPRLSVVVDRFEGLSERSPLVACRLLCEQVPVIGRLDVESIGWPTKESLRAQAKFWAQSSSATLWLRLVAADKLESDMVREAWLAVKFGLDALRYRYLLGGECKTDAIVIMRLAQSDSELDSLWIRDLVEAFEVAREYRAPPVGSVANVKMLLASALACVRYCSERF